MTVKKFTAFGVGVCAAACVGSIALPVILGAGVLGLGGFSATASGLRLDYIACLVLPLVLIGVWYWNSRRTAKQTASCSVDASCGCNPAGIDAAENS